MFLNIKRSRSLKVFLSTFPVGWEVESSASHIKSSRGGTSPDATNLGPESTNSAGLRIPCIHDRYDMELAAPILSWVPRGR